MSQKELVAVSRAETEVLRIVWHLGQATVQQVADQLPANRGIAYATVQTLLRRLEKKGYIRHHVEGKAHVFIPAARKERVIQRSVRDFLDRLFDGDPLPLVQHLAAHGHITAEDIERLRDLIKEK
jgi:BlaI family transcriptional regulator, penicillinase repressor